MGNQQGKLWDPDLCWLGGFFDGEGSVIFKRMGGNRLREMGLDYYGPHLNITNTSEATLAEVTRILAEHRLPFYVERRTPNSSKNKPSWSVWANGIRRCRRWLEVLTPYLHTKRSEAELMLEFIDSRLSVDGACNPRRGYSDREAEILLALRKRVPIDPQRLTRPTGAPGA